MVKKMINEPDSNIENELSEIPCVKKLKCKILQIEETKYRTTFTKKFENRKKYLPVPPGRIISTLPGTVLDVMVKNNETVKEGQPLMIYEAMKMKNRVIVPVNGKVKILNVKKGDVVCKGQLIAEIE